MARILVVEDDAPVRDAIRRALVRQGYSVSIASDGAAALAMIEDSPPDLIILDIYLSGLDGRQFMKAYRQRLGPHAPILLITGAGYAAQRAAALDVASHIDKPFRPDELLAEVEKILSSPRIPSPPDTVH